MTGFPIQQLPHGTRTLNIDRVQFVPNPEAVHDALPLRMLPPERDVVVLELSPTGAVRMGAHQGTLYYSFTEPGATWGQDDELMAHTMMRRHYEDAQP